MFSVCVLILAERNLFLIAFILKPAFREIMVVVFKACIEELNLFRYNIWKQLFRR